MRSARPYPAGALCAGPRAGDFKKAREWFALTIQNQPGKRKALQITKESAYNAQLDIKPASGCALVDSEITDQNSRGAGVLWTGPDPRSAPLHRYHLSDAYSSQEYVIIEGTVTKPGAGSVAGSPPPFRVTVPSVDVDWEGFADWSHEAAEDTRFVVVPLNTNSVDDIRRLWVQTPYDDCSLVRPVLTLLWAGANDLRLFREDGSSFPNGGTIDSRDVSFPLRLRVEPLAPTTEFVVRLLGEEDNVTGEKAVDTIHGRIVNVDLDIDANYDGAITDADEPKEEDPGGYACVCTNSLTPINLTLEPAGLTGTLTLSANVGDTRIKVWQDMGRATQVTLPKTWNAGAQPGTVYVEGVTNSAAARDVELRLEYDENPAGQSNPLFKCEDRVRLTVIKVEIGDLQRVPVYGADPLGSNEKSVNVNVTPSPIPGGGSVTLALSSLTGTGAATFDNGSTTKTTTQTTTVKVRGTTNSSTKDNLKLAAQLAGTECANDVFTVSTWPYEFRNQLQSQNDHFGLTVSMSWKSESGNIADLGNVELREYVTYPHPGANPPFTVHGADPTILPSPPMPGTCGGAGYQDSHDYQPAWVDYSTSATDYMESSQDYQFRDKVLNTSWGDGVLATFTVKREVIDNPGATYKFKTSKTGTGSFSESCTETP